MALGDYFFGEIGLRFDRAVECVLPTFQARPKRWLGEARTWSCTGDASLQFLIWVEWRRPTHGFTVDIGWSSGGALPKNVSTFASAGPDAAQHRFALSELWSPGNPGQVWSCCSGDADIPAWTTEWGLNASRQSERGYRILEAGLLSADSAIADAIEKLLDYGVPFFRRVAVAHGMDAVEIDRALPLFNGPRPAATADAAMRSARLARLLAVGQPTDGPSIPREIWATTVALAPETRWALRGYAALRDRHSRDVPRFWCVPAVLTGTEAVVAVLVACVAAAAFDGPAWFSPVLFVGLVSSGLANPWIRYKRRLRRLSRRTYTEQEFIRGLNELIPQQVPPAETSLAVRRAYSLALDLPTDAVKPSSNIPAFRLGDCPPMLHEFAIYLSELLPSKPDPFILGNLLARHKPRVCFVDFIEATDGALRDIDKAEPHGRVYK